MNKPIMWAARAVTVGALLWTGPVLADGNLKTESGSGERTDPAKSKAPDNTGRNRAERQAGEPTAEQQKNNVSDLEVTRLIRRAVVTDKTLSMYAHNVKIIVQNGTVTLKGPVRTEEEKQSIEKKAVDVAGAANVKNELEVAPKK